MRTKTTKNMIAIAIAIGLLVNISPMGAMAEDDAIGCEEILQEIMGALDGDESEEACDPPGAAPIGFGAGLTTRASATAAITDYRKDEPRDGYCEFDYDGGYTVESVIELPLNEGGDLPTYSWSGEDSQGHSASASGEPHPVFEEKELDGTAEKRASGLAAKFEYTVSAEIESEHNRDDNAGAKAEDTETCFL